MPLDMSKYLDLFVQESMDHLEALSAELVELERAGGPGIVDSLFRHAHSLKGMSASMGFEVIASLSHHLEDLVDLPRRGIAALDKEATDLLLEAADALGLYVQAVSEGRALDAVEYDADALTERLKAAFARLRGEEEEAAPPSPATQAPAAPAAPTASSDAPSLLVRVEVSGRSKVPGVRGFLVYKRLAELGEVVRCEPNLHDLKAGRLPDNLLELVLNTATGRASVEKALGTVAELESVQISPYQEAPEEAPEAATGPARPRAQANVRSVRIRVDLLDAFMDSMGELILAIEQLRQISADQRSPEGRTPLAQSVDRLDGIVRGLHHQVMATRMTPLSSITDRLPRVVREVSRQVEKEADLRVEGAEIELDRAILDELDGALIHLLRNCVDHGLEGPAERDSLGKTRAGQLSLTARRDRDRVEIRVSDDGQGFDRARLLERAVRAGALSEAQAERLSEEEAWMLACLPGLSTREQVSGVSGRGVGMDAVKATVESMGGTLSISSRPGHGSTFTLRLPLTVAIQKLLLVKVGPETYGLPLNKVVHVSELTPEERSRSRGRSMIPYLDGLVPTYDLQPFLGHRVPAGVALPHVIVEAESTKLAALAVDHLAGHLEAVIKPLGRPLDLLPGLSGLTLLPDGRPLFILDLPAIIRHAEA